MEANIIGSRIREIRKERNLTLEKFADLVGIGTVYLGEIERGDKMPSIKTFIKLVNNLDLSADFLLRDELIAGKPHVFNEITEMVKDLSPKNLKMVKDVVRSMVENMAYSNKQDED